MKEENKGFDERTNLINKGLGLILLLLGTYGIIYSYKTFKK
jgi:hypothetical protein